VERHDARPLRQRHLCQLGFRLSQLAFNTDPGVGAIDSLAAGAFYSQWLMTESRRQAKYTTDSRCPAAE